MKRNGFTLAEILITLGIIGVVAAIIMPALFTNVERATLEKQTSKFYNRLVTALSTYKADNESPTITNTEFNADNFINNYFVAERCNEVTDCFASSYTNINGKDDSLTETSTTLTGATFTSAYKLKDGAVFIIDGYDENESLPMTVYFDVNGQKGPNKIGRDFWAASIYYDGSIDDSVNPEARKTVSANDINDSVKERFDACLTDSYAGCFGHFMRNGFKFDY